MKVGTKTGSFLCICHFLTRLKKIQKKKQAQKALAEKEKAEKQALDGEQAVDGE